MNITVDRSRCRGHALCEGIAPGVFEVDDDDAAQVLVSQPGADLEPQVRQAVAACPERAISTDG